MKTEMLLNCGHTTEQVIDFLGKACKVHCSFVQFFKLLADGLNLGTQVGKLNVKGVEAVVNSLEFVDD